jgi:hypothetical protein
MELTHVRVHRLRTAAVSTAWPRRKSSRGAQWQWSTAGLSGAHRRRKESVRRFVWMEIGERRQMGQCFQSHDRRLNALRMPEATTKSIGPCWLPWAARHAGAWRCGQPRRLFLFFFDFFWKKTGHWTLIEWERGPSRRGAPASTFMQYYRPSILMFLPKKENEKSYVKLSTLGTVLFWRREHPLPVACSTHMIGNAYLTMRKPIIEQYNQRLRQVQIDTSNTPEHYVYLHLNLR